MDVNERGVPAFLQRKKMQQASVPSSEELIQRISSKVFRVMSRGYCMKEVDSFMTEISDILKSNKATALTVEKIESKDFSITDSGYDVKSVDTFLDQLSDDIEAMLKDSGEIKEIKKEEIHKSTRKFGDYGSFRYYSADGEVAEDRGYRLTSSYTPKKVSDDP